MKTSIRMLTWVGLALFLSGLQLPQAQAADGAAAANHNRSYHPHPFFESSVTRPEFGERPEKRYGKPPAIPDLPFGLEELEPLTLQMETRHGEVDPRAQIRTITRSAEQIHVVDAKVEQQWLFRRNPLDPRRVFGQLIDVHDQVILEFHESDLADANIAHGWADLASAGVSRKVLDQMKPTQQTEAKFGMVFRKLIPEQKNGRTSATLPAEVWWNERYQLPLRVVYAGSSRVQELTNVQKTVDDSLLQAPRLRYPGFSIVDKADWKSCDTNHYGLAQHKTDH